jgi:hypothetical protein
LKHGKDSRFDDLKTDPKKFSGMWWVSSLDRPTELTAGSARHSG